MKMKTRRAFSYGLFLLSCAMSMNAQEASYVKTTTMTSDSSSIVTAEYVDGLGRTSQCVMRDASPGGGDLVTLQEYDLNGRESKAWLPASMNSGGSSCGIDVFKQNAASSYGDSSTYSLIRYDNSPLNRTTKEFGPGASWHNADKGVETVYTTNSSLNPCRKYELTSDGGSFSLDGNWPSRNLDVIITTDEDGNKCLTFKDLRGLVMLERIIDIRDNNRQHDTYYVYDEYGNLRYVLPPMASDRLTAQGVSWNMDTEDVARYCYCYQYDTRNLCISKKLPGCEPVLMRYDKAHRLVFSQDGNLRTSNKWHVTVYDGLGRSCFDGLCSGDSLPDVKQIEVKATFSNGPVGSSPLISGGTLGYSLNISLNDIEPLSANYFDSYNFLNYFANEIRYPLQYRNMDGYDSRYHVNGSYAAHGLLTGTVNCVLGDSALLVKSIYYDDHDNVIQSHEANILGGYERYYAELSFTGTPLKEKRVHEMTDTITDVYQYTYDNMERLITVTVSRDGEAAVTLASNSYDSLGRLSLQALGSHANGEVDYSYNVRGWTQSISSEHFSQTLHYEQPGTGATPCYNGNVSAMDWNALDAMAAATPISHRYTFDYDGLNRLTAAHYGTINSQSTNGRVRFDGAHNYSATYEYDLNGNITSLTRKGVNSCITVGDTAIWSFGDIDNLSLTYNGNQLKKVTDQCADLTYAGAMDFKDGANKTVEYLWDANGNMTRDRNKKIWTIKYNVLNLPERIEYMDGHIVLYTYASDGRKLKTEYQISNVGVLELNGIDAGSTMGLMGGGIIPFDPPGPLNPPGPIGPVLPTGPTTYLTMDYCGNHIYRNGVLERTMNGYGYQADSTYYYYIKDYQGNVRAVIDQNGALKEINNYYPYGGLMGAASAGVQPNKYGGKELDRQNGIDWYDFEARYQDPMLPMFTTIDPLAEKTPSISPYVHCAGNPVKYIDLNGLSPIYSNYGEFLGVDNQGLRGTAIIMEKESYKLGMPHAQALKNSYTGKVSPKAHKMIDNHYSKLKYRPDYDGFVTREEGIMWAHKHPNALKHPTPDNALYVDASKIDFADLTTADFDEENKVVPQNLFNCNTKYDLFRSLALAAINHRRRNSVYALGEVRLELLSRKDRTVRIENGYSTVFDWNYGGGRIRNALIFFERAINFLDDSHGFNVYYYGVGKLKR